MYARSCSNIAAQVASFLLLLLFFGGVWGGGGLWGCEGG